MNKEIIEKVYEECIGKLNVQDVITDDFEEGKELIILFMEKAYEKALKLKEEEVLKKIKILKDGFIEDWEFCKKANTEPHIHPRRVIEFIDKIFEEELKGNKK